MIISHQREGRHPIQLQQESTGLEPRSAAVGANSSTGPVDRYVKVGASNTVTGSKVNRAVPWC